MIKLRRLNITFAIIACALLSCIVSYIVVLVKVDEDLERQTASHLKDLTIELGDHINSKIDERFAVLATYSYYVSTAGDISDEDMILFTEECAKREDLISIEVLEYDEKLVPGNEETLNEETDSNGNEVIAFYLPVENSDNPFIVKGTCSIENFEKTVSIKAFGQTGNTFIVKRDGDVVTDSSGASSLESIFNGDEKYVKKLVSSIQSRNNGNITYYAGNKKRYICYSNISYNNWYVVAMVSSGIVESNYDNVNKRGIVLTTVLFVVITIMISYIIYFNYRYSLYRKIVDERREIYAKQTGTVLFDYKVKKKQLAMSGDADNIFGNGFDFGSMANYEKSPYLTDKSKEKIKELYVGMKVQTTWEDVPIEVIATDGNIKSVNLNITAIKLKNGQIVRLVGSIK